MVSKRTSRVRSSRYCTSKANTSEGSSRPATPRTTDDRSSMCARTLFATTTLAAPCSARISRASFGVKKSVMTGMPSARVADLARRVDAEHAVAAAAEELEQRAVVRADLDHQAARGRGEPADHGVGV